MSDGLDPGSFGGHPYSAEERALGYGTDHDPRFMERETAPAPDDLTHYMQATARLSRENERLRVLGTKLADAAERLEENPLANCLPRYRYPVQDAVAAWREATTDA